MQSNFHGIFIVSKVINWVPSTKTWIQKLQDATKSYQMMLGQSSQRIPSIIAGKIQCHLEVQGHHKVVLPNQSKRI